MHLGIFFMEVYLWKTENTINKYELLIKFFLYVLCDLISRYKINTNTCKAYEFRLIIRRIESHHIGNVLLHASSGMIVNPRCRARR